MLAAGKSKAPGELARRGKWRRLPRSICTSLPGPRETEEVFFGRWGVVSGLRGETLCIDFTTNSPAVVRTIAGRVAERARGTSRRAGERRSRRGPDRSAHGAGRRRGDGVGPKPTAARCAGDDSVARRRGGRCQRVQAAAQLRRILANLATVECLTAGVKAGVPAATLVEVFQKSGLGRNLDLQVAMPATLFRGNFEPRFLMRTAL